ncbi:hypothetical protein [Dubosiella newyorkensis]
MMISSTGATDSPIENGHEILEVLESYLLKDKVYLNVLPKFSF